MIELRILGTPTLLGYASGKAGSPHLQPKPLALLAYLAVAGAGRSCRRDTLVGLLWPDLDETHARNALSQALYRLRRALGNGALHSRGAEEVCIETDVLWCDVLAFDEAIEKGRLDEALALYRGPFLDGFHISESSEFEHWQDVERETMRSKACRAAAELVDRNETAGNLAATAYWLRRLLDLSPSDESVLRHLMDVLSRLGDRAGALRRYGRFVRTLSEELDMTPSPETQALAARLRAQAPSSATAARDTPSVAVLPFSNLTADPDQEFFCDGMTEELIHALTHIQGLRVTARTTVFALKHRNEDVRRLGLQLGVDTVLEGSVRRAGDRIRVTAQLVDASTGYHLWSERYDRPSADVLTIQDDIAESIASAFKRELTKPSGDRPRSAPGQTAHTLYMRGLFHRRKRTSSSLEKAVACFEQAVKHDPDYAEAYAAAAYTYALGGWFIYDAFAPRRAYPAAREAAARALALDDRLSEAHMATGFTRWAFDWDWKGAEEDLKRALALDPNNPDTIGQYSSYQVVRGRVDEALDLLDKLEDLEPFWFGPKVYRGVWQLFDRRYEAAIALLREAYELEPNVFLAPFFLGDAYRFTNRPDQARTAYDSALESMGRRPLILGRIAALHAELNQQDEARSIIAELRTLSETQYVQPTIVAGIYVALHEHDAAFEWLEKAFDVRDAGLTLLRGYPLYDPLRTAPRFQSLLAKIG